MWKGMYFLRLKKGWYCDNRAHWGSWLTCVAVLDSCRVIQMIDENKEQLRNLFRKYNVVDVQPAISDKLPDDITTLQV